MDATSTHRTDACEDASRRGRDSDDSQSRYLSSNSTTRAVAVRRTHAWWTSSISTDWKCDTAFRLRPAVCTGPCVREWSSLVCDDRHWDQHLARPIWCATRNRLGHFGLV